jgi:hypothetical protein
MAAKAFVLTELETVLRSVVAGDRSYRLDAMNAFRVANSKSEVDYLVNTETISRADYDTALAAFTTDVGNAAAGSVTGETTELEDIFTYLLTAGRVDRLAVLNVVRTELTLDTVDYLVNMHVPLPGEAATALAAVTADAAA